MIKKRESRYVRFARLEYEVAQASLPVYSHAKSPHRYTQPQLAACVMLGIYLRLSYRNTEELLLASDQLCAVLELAHVPNYATLNRTFRKIRLAEWERMQKAFLRAINDGDGVEEEYVAVDRTNFAPTQASSTFLSKAGRTHSHYFTGAFAVGTASLLILAVRTGIGPRNDMPYLKPLRKRAQRYGRKLPNGRRLQVLLGDRGFDGKDVLESDLIPPIRRNNRIRHPARLAKVDLLAQARLDGIYGQRWKVETVNSVIKRKFGDAVRSRTNQLRLREIAAKALVYNLHVLFFCLYQILVPNKAALASG